MSEWLCGGFQRRRSRRPFEWQPFTDWGQISALLTFQSHRTLGSQENTNLRIHSRERFGYPVAGSFGAGESYESLHTITTRKFSYVKGIPPNKLSQNLVRRAEMQLVTHARKYTSQPFHWIVVVRKLRSLPPVDSLIPS
jgi:hypothetical protein